MYQFKCMTRLFKKIVSVLSICKHSMANAHLADDDGAWKAVAVPAMNARTTEHRILYSVFASRP
jgi:hypothetical protein